MPLTGVTTLAVTATSTGNQVALDGDADITLSSTINALGLASQGIIISEEIISADLLPFDLPGPNDEPGHSQLRDHIGDDSGDTNPAITQRAYNFRSFIGYISAESGDLQPSYNTITEAQKTRAREVFEILSQVAGVQFYETEDQGLIVATGDLRVAGSESGPGNVIGFSGTTFFNAPDPLATPHSPSRSWIMRRPGVTNTGLVRETDRAGSQWRCTKLATILVSVTPMILPRGTVMGADGTMRVLGDLTEPLVDGGQRREPVFPGDHDIVHLQHIHEPDSRDIDLYKFELTEPGQFTAETIAERHRDHTDSNDLLDTVISVYQVRVEVDSTQR